jgi:hypothetical protein
VSLRKVQRSEILDWKTYDDGRQAARAAIMEVKRPRRIHVGPHLTFLFENADTLRYQVQEVMRAERMVREAEIQQEIDTYNALLGGEGELACALLIEIDDKAERDRALRAWRDLPEHIYLRTERGLVRPSFDPGQIDDEKISAVQYLRFPVGGAQPLAVGCDLPPLVAETVLDDEQRAALTADLAS